ncbi:MAG TPA: serine/threonine-protein kinase [Myxococcales bacterium]|jgi:serine/threonine-protein kinase
MNELPEKFGDKYRVLRSLARGGMGEVFLARHEGPGGFSRDVVIKTLLPDLAEDESLVSMFLAEAKVAALLTHQNIVHLYDFGQQDGVYFIVMELLQGESLSALLRAARRAQRTLTPGFVAAIGSQVCAGLSYAWTRPGPDGKPLALVHRDISPQNILACSDGSAKVLDFGIAKYAGSSAFTSPGSIKGKPSYLSPEHLGISPVDDRSDQFCLGIVLWELVAGRQLFTNDLAQAALTVAHEPAPDLTKLEPTTPPALAAIIARALRIAPGERYSSAAEMGRALDGFLLHTGALAADEIRAELAAFANLRAPAQPSSPKPLPAAVKQAATRIEEPAFPVPSWLLGDTNPFTTTAPVFPEAPPALDPSMSDLDGPRLGLDGPTPIFDTSAPFLDPESGVDASAPPPRQAVARRTHAIQPEADADDVPLELAAPIQQYEPAAPEPASEPAPEPVPAPALAARAPSAPGASSQLPMLIGVAVLLVALAVGLALFLRAPKSPDSVKVSTSNVASDLVSTTLAIDSIPPGAAIALDGRPTGKVTPEKFTVDTGRDHVVELSHPNCFPFKTTVFAAPHEALTVQAPLKFGARVSVTSEPTGAQVDVDGEPALTAPASSAVLAPGKHVLVARLAGRAFDSTEIQIVDTESSDWAAKLVPGVAVQIASEPEGAAISVDGRPSGSVTPAEVWVAAGKKHVVRLSLQGLLSSTHALPAARAGAPAQKISAKLKNAKVVELKSKLAALAAQLAKDERKLEKLRSQQSGYVVKDARKEMELNARVEELEAELERSQTDAAILREELDKASGPTR